MSRRWEGREVLITGGLGFIGSNLASRLVDWGALVTIIDLPEPRCIGHLGNIAHCAGQVRVIRADLAEAGDWRESVGQAEFIFHLAAQVSHTAGQSAPLADLSANCETLLNILEAARQSSRNPKIVFASTRQVYGRVESLPVHETHALRPTDINGVHKVAAEEYLRVYRASYGLRSTILRLTNTYGPRMDLRNPGRGVLNVFIAKALRGELIDIFGDGQQRRDMLHVDDVTDALTCAAAIDEPGPFHLGETAPTSLRDFLRELGVILPIQVRYLPFPENLRAIDIGDSHCDYSNFTAATGWGPSVSLSEGLPSTIEWARSHAFAFDRAEPAAR